MISLVPQGLVKLQFKLRIKVLELRQSISFVSQTAVNARNFFRLLCCWQQCQYWQGGSIFTQWEESCSCGGRNFLLQTELQHSQLQQKYWLTISIFSTTMMQRLRNVFSLIGRRFSGFWATDLASGCTVHLHLVVSLFITKTYSACFPAFTFVCQHHFDNKTNISACLLTDDFLFFCCVVLGFWSPCFFSYWLLGLLGLFGFLIFLIYLVLVPRFAFSLLGSSFFIALGLARILLFLLAGGSVDSLLLAPLTLGSWPATWSSDCLGYFGLRVAHRRAARRIDSSYFDFGLCAFARLVVVSTLLGLRVVSIRTARRIDSALASGCVHSHDSSYRLYLGFGLCAFARLVVSTLTFFSRFTFPATTTTTWWWRKVTASNWDGQSGSDTRPLPEKQRIYRWGCRGRSRAPEIISRRCPVRPSNNATRWWLTPPLRQRFSFEQSTMPARRNDYDLPGFGGCHYVKIIYFSFFLLSDNMHQQQRTTNRHDSNNNERQQQQQRTATNNSDSDNNEYKNDNKDTMVREAAGASGQCRGC